MYFSEISTDDVRDWINQAAYNVVNNYDDDAPIWPRVYDEADSYTCYVKEALTICAYYDVFDVVNGCDWEDSPRKQFENDIYDAALAIAESENVKIPEE